MIERVNSYDAIFCFSLLSLTKAFPFVCLFAVCVCVFAIICVCFLACFFGDVVVWYKYACVKYVM